MSIQEFQTQLAQDNQQNSLMGALSRLSLLDLSAVTGNTDINADWSPWTNLADD
ncbi:MAG: hypothetical protein JOZ15_07865 [Acidobacteria bacterium]|nr:hypothetical protein [Acidobacteriota bacterium]